MGSFTRVYAQLPAMRRKFDTLLDAANAKAPRADRVPAAGVSQLSEIAGFGSNPGNLRMFVHVPQYLQDAAPLVVALHGCSQSADAYDCGSGWSALADRLGFVVLYPQQQPANNPKNCFSWFSPPDITRDQGEALSIRQMIEHAIINFGLDRRRVFVTGLSAGGAMATVMLATYPDVFAGGAILAGLPYGCARSVQQAFEAMFTEQSRSPEMLGGLLRSASKYNGPWPKLSVWHGTADQIVKPSNAEDLIRQWIEVTGLPVSPSFEESVGRHTHRVWMNGDGEAQIEAYSIGGMGHGVPLAVTGENNCGALGPFFLEAGISSTDRIATFWGLLDDVTAVAPARQPLTSPSAFETSPSPLMAAEERGCGEPEEASLRSNASDEGFSSNPARTIAAALRAAGLHNMASADRAAGVASSFDPGAVIKAALKAAGLRDS